MCIEKDAALEHRFQPVVSASRRGSTIGHLRGLKEKYEIHHGVRITIRMGRTALGCISDRFLRSKAIDLSKRKVWVVWF